MQFKSYNGDVSNQSYILLTRTQVNGDDVLKNAYTVKPLYSGHPWDVANWLLYRGGLII